jgi:translation initiation factor 3 subunit I
MKPLMLHGHERAITQIKYNREGDLLFTASKSSWLNVWYSINGERLGTYGNPSSDHSDGYGHTGTIWCLDVDWMSQYLMTGAGDNYLKFWDVETGQEISSVSSKSAVRSCGFSFSRNLAFYSTDKAMNNPSEVFIVDTRDGDALRSASHSIMKFDGFPAKVTAGLWGTLDEFIVTGHENGSIMQWCLTAGKMLNVTDTEHKDSIRDMQPSLDGTMFVTSSKDCTAKLFDMDSLECMKTFKTDRPVNSAALSPNCEHIVLGGGQEAIEVTTTSTRQGKFEARFYHVVFEEEFARVKGHFGPINSVAFHPDGKSYSSGAEDGYVRVQSFDDSYFKFKFDF